MKGVLRAVGAGVVASASGAAWAATDLTVTVTNLSPNAGAFATPVWFGLHDGTFDLYDMGAPVSAELERIAEDGNVMPLRGAFAAAGFNDGVVLGLDGGFAGPIEPGETASATISVDGSHRYFSYASMLIPSNDAFVANGNPMAFEAFDANGNFQPFSFIVMGSMVLDAGSEVNDEIPMNTAFFGQMNPDTGVMENGLVRLHDGFIPGGPILSDPMFMNADFTAPGYRFLMITVTPAPASAGAIGLLAAWASRRRRA